MIFVTVGTHEQQFNRLIKEVDRLVEIGVIAEEVIIQTGFSTYVPSYCTHEKFYSYDEMASLMERARLIITHGGPASFMKVLSMGKTPIVVPRLKKFEEHVNNHQIEFVEKIIHRGYPLLMVENIDSLKVKIKEVLNCENNSLEGNNVKFNEGFTKVINELMEEK
ncbi:MAG: multidrug MFS transporter [Enterococcus sp.]|nr:multidrug MFS transporter [Enterococcus sp.]